MAADGRKKVMYITPEMKQYILDSQDEIKKITKELSLIPAPSHFEDERAAYCKEWFENAGFPEVFIDEAKNVVCPVNDDGKKPIVVFMAHTDTVFPDTEYPMPFEEKDGKYFSPGVTDDTANLAVLMVAARYFVQKKAESETAMLFVANSCEEGLGNLKGSKAIVAAYGSRIKNFISFDGSVLNKITNKAVGSHRYRVVVKTEGGHSFSKFGNRNAIRCMASMIDTLYSVKVPEVDGSKTTYNVGSISGGTSVNTIAQEATMLYEYRSDNRECLAKMEKMFNAVVEAYRATGIEVEVEKIGDRPCSGDIDPDAFKELTDRTWKAIEEITGLEPFFISGSTDCNSSLSVGIPSVCIGVCKGFGAHTRGEWLDLASLVPGGNLAIELMAGYFKA